MPLEVQSHAVPHLKALISGKMEPRGLRCSSLFILCQTLWKNTSLLHKMRFVWLVLATTVVPNMDLRCLYTVNLNEKNLTRNSTWDFDATFYTSDFNWSILHPKFFYQCRAPAVNPGLKNGVTQNASNQKNNDALTLKTLKNNNFCFYDQKKFLLEKKSKSSLCHFFRSGITGNLAPKTVNVPNCAVFDNN